MKLSRSTQAILLAKEKGYYADKEGNIFSRTGNKLKLQKVAHKRKYKTNTYLYYIYSFSVKAKNSRRVENIPVHRFIAYIKFGDNLFIPGIGVRHLNGDSLDNNWDNLELGTQSQNMMDKKPEDRLTSAKHAASFLRSLTEDQVKELRRDRANGFTYSQLMTKYGITKSTVSFIVNRKTYKGIEPD